MTTTTGGIPQGDEDFSFDTLPTSKAIAAQLEDGKVLAFKDRRVSIMVDHNGQQAYAYEIALRGEVEMLEGWESRDQSWMYEHGAAEGDYQTEEHALECLADEIREFWASLEVPEPDENDEPDTACHCGHPECGAC